MHFYAPPCMHLADLGSSTGQLGAAWGSSGRLWAAVGSSGQLSAALGSCGQLWADLGRTGPAMLIFLLFHVPGPLWPILWKH